MRGKDTAIEFRVPVLGITPAYAGKSAVGSVFASGSRDHPRLCGEKSVFIYFSIMLFGSPPPMRGKGDAGRKPRYCVRITPAYAGKSRKASSRDKVMRDHPRLCGEKFRVRP